MEIPFWIAKIFKGFPKSIAFVCLVRRRSYELQGDDLKRR